MMPRYLSTCALYFLGHPLTVFKRVSPRPLGPGMNFSLELAWDRCAALATRHPTYKEDSRLDSEFKKYIKRHYKSWVRFASDRKYGENLRPVLVSGFDMTKDYAMMAYSNNDTSLPSGATFSTPMFGSSSEPTSWIWRTACSPRVKHGPQQRRPPSSTVLTSSQLSAVDSPANEFNQCIFIRYYTMRFELGLFPKVTRAGAGPHDLGSGDNKGDTFPELTVQSDTEPMSGDEDPGAQRDPAVNDIVPEPHMVFRNIPYVWSFACSSIFTLTLASRMENTIVGMPSQTTCSR